MAARTTDRITPDGIKFQRMLKELADKEVRIGFQHGKATEENGADVCDVAAWNELGTERMPSRPFRICRTGAEGDRNFSEGLDPGKNHRWRLRSKR